MRPLGPYYERRMLVTAHPNASLPRKREFVLMAIAALLALFVHFKSAHAEPRFEVSGGVCQETRSDKGSWWNDHYLTKIDLTSACTQLGISDTPWKTLIFGREWNLGWRAAYVDLGPIHTDSIMAMRDEDQFNNPDGSQCDPATNAGCLIRTVGGGRARGFTIGGLLERDLAGFRFEDEQRGTLAFGVEAGLFVYHNYFTIDISPYQANGGAAPNISTHWNMADGWLATPYIGANLRFVHLMVSGRIYQRVTAHATGCGGCSGVTKGPAYQLNAGISIPF